MRSASWEVGVGGVEKRAVRPRLWEEKKKRAGDAASPGKARLKFVPPAFLSFALLLNNSTIRCLPEAANRAKVTFSNRTFGL